MRKFRVGDALYIDTFVQHSIPIPDLKGDIKWMMKENKMDIYKTS